MYNAQQKGGNNYQLHKSEAIVISLEKFALETNLRNALKRSEFHIYYQPKVDLKKGKITGAEALIRWFHPGKGWILPEEFIPLAEETGLIISIKTYAPGTPANHFQIWHFN